MIKYLVGKRQDTLKEEYGESIPAHLLHPPVGPNQEPAAKAKQEELQNRVQKILSRSKVTNQQGSSGLTPSLQAAIENLVKTGPNGHYVHSLSFEMNFKLLVYQLLLGNKGPLRGPRDIQPSSGIRNQTF